MYKNVIFTVILTLVVLFCTSSTLSSQENVSISVDPKNLPNISPNSIISDALFLYAPEFDTVEEIQAFLDRQPGILASYTENVYGVKKSAAEILLEVSYEPAELEYGLNPQVLLVLLELHSHLVSDPNPSSDTIQDAMGFNDPSWRGLYPQLIWTVRHLKRTFLSYYPVGQSATQSSGIAPNAASVAIELFITKNHSATNPGSASSDEKIFQETWQWLFGTSSYLVQANTIQAQAVSPFLYRPYPGTPNITSILDHSITGTGYNQDDIIRPYSGIRADQCVTTSSGLRKCHSSSNERCVPDSRYSDGSNCWYDGHPGYDYGMAINTPITAGADGTVSLVCISNCAASGPKYVKIQHNVGGTTWTTNYFHLNSVSVNPRTSKLWKNGDSIYRSEEVGKSGNAGTGEHLHFSVLRNGAVTDPYGWCGTDGDPLPNHGSSSPSTWLWSGENALCGGPTQPTFGSVYATGPNTIHLTWTANSNPSIFHIYNLTNAKTYSTIGSSRAYDVSELRCNEEYRFELSAITSGKESTRTSTKVRTGTCPGAAAKITSVQISPESLRSGEYLEVRIDVKNIGDVDLPTQGPPPGYEYQEGQSAESLGFINKSGSFRVGIGCNGTTACKDYPYRWGLGDVLKKGDSATIVGRIRLTSVRNIHYFAGLVEENVTWHQPKEGEKPITVSPAATGCIDTYEPNEDWAHSRKVNIGETIQAYMCDKNDKDWFYVKVPGSGRLVVDVWNIPLGNDYDVEFYHGENGYISGSYKNSNNSEHYEFNVESGQEYDAKVYSFENYSTSLPYSIRFQFSAGKTTAPIVSTQMPKTNKGISAMSTGIYGLMNYQGVGQPDIPLELRFYDGVSFTTVATTTTDLDGSYSFVGVPSLGPSQLYQVRFRNIEDNPNYLYEWWGNYITEYYAGDNVRGGDFDIADVALGTPNSLDGQFFPVEFLWTPRLLYSDEQYAVEIYYGGQTYWTPLQYTNGSYLMDTLPPELRADQDLSWDVVVVTTDGVGISRGFNQLRFSPGTGNLTGHLTYQGQPDPGADVGLYFYDGSQWQVVDWTASDNEGVYQFSRLSALEPGQSYSPFFINFDDPEKPDRIWYGDCYDITQYDPNAFNSACDIETKDMFLEGPYIQPEIFPVHFNWSTRDSLYPESYELHVYDFEAGSQFVTPAMINAQEYTLNALPSDFTGQDYFWEIWSYSSMGRAVSYAMNHVNGPGSNQVFLPLVIRNSSGTTMNTLGRTTTVSATQTMTLPIGSLSRDLYPISRPVQIGVQSTMLQIMALTPISDSTLIMADRSVRFK